MKMIVLLLSLASVLLSIGCAGRHGDPADRSHHRGHHGKGGACPHADGHVCAHAGHADAWVVRDPAVFDAQAPPLLIDTQFVSGGAKMNAIIYEAQGAGPHPTVVLLHGFPGNEKNLDVAQAVRRAGWNVVFFHYRGAWGSEGEFSFGHILEDVAAVVEAISEPTFASAHRIDSARLAVVGHSMGGFAALISGAELDSIDCVVSMAGANLGGTAKAMQANPEGVEELAGLLDSWSGPIKGPGARALIDELGRQADRFDTTLSAPALAKKRLLLLAGEIDQVTPPAQSHAPLVAALEREGAESLSERVIPNADHSFSGQRIELTREVTRWLVETCAAPDARANVAAHQEGPSV
jgi:pimeloyl-ACP methyl ester carboxylesterase